MEQEVITNGLMDLDKSVLEVSKAKEMIDYYGRFKLKPLQLKFLDLIIAATDPKADKLAKVEFPNDVLCWNLGMVTSKAVSVTQYHMNKKVIDLCESLMGKVKVEDDKETTITQMPWFSLAKVDKKNNKVTIILSEKLNEFLLLNKSMGRKFHEYHFNTINNLHQRESILLYMLLNSVYVCEKGSATYTIDELKQKLCIVPNPEHHTAEKKNNKVTYADILGNTIGTSMQCNRPFKRLVVGKAVDDINDNTDIHVKALMTPTDQPDHKKTHVVFEVSDNPDFKGTRPSNRKNKITGFVNVDQQQMEALDLAAEQELKKLKDLIISCFDETGPEYIDIIDEYYPSKKTLIQIVNRCEWLIEIKQFEEEFGGKALKSLIKVEYISPGLFRRAVDVKKDHHVKGETTKLRNFKGARKANVASTQPKMHAKRTNDEIANLMLLTVLGGYKMLHEDDWESKITQLDAVVENDMTITSRTKKEIRLIKSVYSNTNKLTWCAFAAESKETKTTYFYSEPQILQELIGKHDLTVEEAKANAQNVKEILDELIICPLNKAVVKATLLREF